MANKLADTDMKMNRISAKAIKRPLRVALVAGSLMWGRETELAGPGASDAREARLGEIIYEN